MMQLEILDISSTPPPCCPARFPTTVQPVRLPAYAPPPKELMAELLITRQFSSDVCIVPPPWPLVAFPLTMQCLSTPPLAPPPYWRPQLLLNVQLIKVPLP